MSPMPPTEPAGSAAGAGGAAAGSSRSAAGLSGAAAANGSGDCAKALEGKAKAMLRPSAAVISLAARPSDAPNVAVVCKSYVPGQQYT